jgi:filamentous hemagglutinin family protein
MKLLFRDCEKTLLFTAAGRILLGIALLSSSLVTESLKAQTITPAQDGTNTVILQNGQRFDITGGTQGGANLFHSFQQFGLSQGQIANFLSNPSIQNILSRVVGGDPSVINGLIQLTGGNSNLYIMNPAGIIFGGNASLNVPAAFTATTASGIQVGNGWFGMNTSAAELKNLTGNPLGFAFINPSTTTPATGQTGVILNQGNLTATQGQSITLVGGIVINTGTITTPNGKINIVASADGKYVRVTPEGGVLSLDLPVAAQQELGTRAITGVDLPKLLTGTGITAPTKAGEAIVKGQLTAANIDILANRYNTTQASLNATNIQQGWNLVFVDSTVKNYQTLIDGTKGGSSVTVINPDQYGINKITTTLADITGANSLHIVSEGDAGNFWLGKDFVSSENISQYSSDLQAWRTALSPAATILLYACNLASGENGAALVQAVKTYTGHDVAASTNRTGAVALGGDWNLEYQTGKNPATVIFNNAATNAYQNTLAIFTATNANDAGAGSLRAQVIAANAAVGADEIRFSFSGTPIVLTTGQIQIIDDLTISGNGQTNTIIDGNANSRIFNITTTGAVNIDGVTFRNGKVAGLGATGQGGAILNNGGGAVTVSNSAFSGNSATSQGGAIQNLAANGRVTINNSTFSGNFSGSFGGAIENDATNGVLTINNSTFSNNTATSFGGAIESEGTNATLTISNSTFLGNTSPSGGAISSFAGTASISNSTFFGNTGTDGGAILVNNQTAISNSTFFGNTGTEGGAIRIGNSIAATATIANSIIVGNTATTGSEISRVTGTLTFRGANIVGTNSVNGISGGFTGVTPIVPTGAASTVIRTTLANNGGSTQTLALFPGSIALDGSTTTGGAVPTTTDQRGAPVVGIRDLGAVEFQGYGLLPLANTTPQTTNINTNFANLLGVQVVENFVNVPVALSGILVTFTPSSTLANGSFSGNASVLTNNLGIAFAPALTANGNVGDFTVSATATGFKPATFSLTNKSTVNIGGFGGVYPSREDVDGRPLKQEVQEREDSKALLCLDSALPNARSSSIPACDSKK